MTFLSAPNAVDGAEFTGAHARRANYFATSGEEGIAQRADLKVSQLVTPANGLLISSGNAAILNRYQTTPNEAYVVSNPDTHTITSLEMPTSQPSAKSYLVLITVGDQEFTQVGHPWMPSEPLEPEEAIEFQYVRPWLLEVPAGTTSFAGLGLFYPALAIARVDIPATTTTITNAMITDLRKLARPRRSEELFIVSSGMSANTLNTVTPTYEAIGQTQSVVIPSWAKRAKVVVNMEAFTWSGAVIADFRVNVVSGPAGPAIRIDKSAPAGADRFGMTVAANLDVASVSGTTKTFRIEGRTLASGYNDKIAIDGLAASFMRIVFEEEPV